VSTPTQQEKRAVEPAIGIKAHAPDDIDKTSILNHAAPMLDELDGQKQSLLSTLVECFDQSLIEKRITLLARLIIEDALWNKDGLSRKERADVAFQAIRVLEGSKSTLWVEDPSNKNIPKSTEALAKAKDEVEARLMRLVKNKQALMNIKAKAVEDALEVVESDKASS